MPDIENARKLFVRIAHGIIIFPGGVGTAEELLYLLGFWMNPANKNRGAAADPDRPKRERRLLPGKS